MSDRKTRTCCVCYRKYQFCPVCNPEDREKPTFYFAYCSENCRDIYKTTSDYEDGRISANTAKKKLDKLDLSMIENFGESYINTISKINENITKTSDVKKDNEIDEVISDSEETKNEEVIKKIYKPQKKVKNDGSIE